MRNQLEDKIEKIRDKLALSNVLNWLKENQNKETITIPKGIREDLMRLI